MNISRDYFRSPTNSPRLAAALRYALFGLMLLAPAARAEDEADRLALAERLRLTGRYEEAEELYTALAEADPVAAALGSAACLRARGETDLAQRVLHEAAEKHPDVAELNARQAQLAWERGDHQAAQLLAEKAQQIDANNLLSRWVVAELHTAAGRLEEAEKAYEWFIDFYNDAEEVTHPDDLLLIGQAAAEYARWTRNSNQFRFLINELYPAILKRQANYWPARLAAGLLFLEKYNQASAVNELNAALAINPHAAEIHAARAAMALQNFDLTAAEQAIDRALELNPRLVAAHQAQADLHMANFELAKAIAVLEHARELNPRDEETLGRLAAVHGAVEGLPVDWRQGPSADSPMAQRIDQALMHNAHCGTFFETMGDTFDLLRRYPAAAHFYQQAEQRMPQLIAVRGKLGMVLMRLGDEVAAAPALQQSFADDPFNVRVKNMLEVLDVLSGYAVLETEHFVIKFDRGQDEILAQAVSRYLEEQVYPLVVEKMGYAPEGKTLFEIFNRARNTGGHGWFSARMVGLPYIGTVGACAGKMVALVSPDAMPKKFSWGRVLKHEFIHVVNLQQTNFNVPHWFTEALAVWNEELPRPADWTALLARRAANDKLFNLDNINFGFVRPANDDDWTLAYCQAELYAEYLLHAHGEDALAKMLTAYGENCSTREALQRCFGVAQEDFEKGYRAYLEQIVAKAGPHDDAGSLDLAALQKAVKDDPRNPDHLARLAYAHLQRKSNPPARRLALAAQQLDAKHQLAAYVLARLQVSIGDSQQARAILEDAVSEEAPQENALALLAGLKLQAKQYADAARLYRLGVEKFGDDEPWLKALARVYLQAQDQENLLPVLEKLAELDGDDVVIRKKLALEALKAKDYAGAEKWANQALLIDVMDADLHAALAQAAVAQERYPQAAAAYERAVRIQPKQLAWRFSLADAQAQAGQTATARKTLEELLRIDPDFPGADVLLESLTPP